MTLILGALDGEITEIIEGLSDRQEQSWGTHRVYSGRIAGTEVVVAKSGVGKVYSAAVAQHLIDRYRPERVIFTGVAGALNEDYRIGDIVVARDCVQYDLDASDLGFAKGEVPYTGLRELACDPELVRLASSLPTETEKVHVGRILTGDRFITTAGDAQFAYLRDELFGDVVEMEGAAVAMVATLNELPFLIVRTVSDHADKETGKDFETVLSLAARHARAMVRHLLENVTVRQQVDSSDSVKSDRNSS
jgi:5'-methylthioadenosine/S-adenosylhomocysteine nucleosidase